MKSNMDEQKEKIKEEAKKILDKFSSALEKIKIQKKSEEKNMGGFREEGLGAKTNETFRKIMFKNSPNNEGDSILAEKKKWR